MRQKNIFFLLLLLLVLIMGFVLTLGYTPRARLFPLIVITACGILVVAELLKYLAAGQGGAVPGEGDGKDHGPQNTKQPSWSQFLATLAWLAGFMLALWFLGFTIGLPLFLFAYVKVHEKGWLWALSLTAAMFLVVYVGFGLLLETPLYEGWLFLQ